MSPASVTDPGTLLPIWQELALLNPVYYARSLGLPWTDANGNTHEGDIVVPGLEHKVTAWALAFNSFPRLAAAQYVLTAAGIIANPSWNVTSPTVTSYGWQHVDPATLSALALEGLNNAQAIYDRELAAVWAGGGAGGASSGDFSKTLEELFGAAIQHPTMMPDPDNPDGPWIPVPGTEPPDDPGPILTVIPPDGNPLTIEMATADDVAAWIAECKGRGGWPVYGRDTQLQTAGLAQWLAVQAATFAGVIDWKVCACRLPATPGTRALPPELLPDTPGGCVDERAPIAVLFHYWVNGAGASLAAASDAVMVYVGKGAEAIGATVRTVAGGLMSGLGWIVPVAVAAAVLMFRRKR